MKFRDRLAILSDDMASISFEASQGEGNDLDPSTPQFKLQLKSKHMRANVTNRSYPAKAKENTDIRAKYKVALKKEVFLKFFQILKLGGQGLMKMNHKEVIEMEYTLDKCPFLSLVLETTAR